MATYITEIIEKDKIYKPMQNKRSGAFDNYFITKFLVLENGASGNVKLWTNGVDPSDEDSAVEIPASALIVGQEYDLTVGKMSWNGNLKVLGYQTSSMPLDFPVCNLK